jgi:hypothetical protein
MAMKTPSEHHSKRHETALKTELKAQARRACGSKKEWETEGPF